MKVKGELTPWARWLKAQLKAKGWGYTELMRRTGMKVSESAIRYQIREGRTPEVSTIALIEKALGEKCPVWT